ncbi:MAG: multicopper oxidase family protein [Gemmatimonadales bacterium]
MKRREALQRLGFGVLAGALTNTAAFTGERRLAGAAQNNPSSSFEPDVDLTLTAEVAEAAILPGRPTQVWRFTGTILKGPPGTLQPVGDSHLGPTIRVRKGNKVRIRFSNRLPEESTIVHWHGLDVPEAADGHPRFAIAPGSEYVYEFTVVNRAGTYWYHPHPHQRTGAHIYRGLAGMFIVEDDEEEAAGLPRSDSELLCVLQDRRFDGDNQLVYVNAAGPMMDQMHGFLGDQVLVNGRKSPQFDLATRAYRVRILNGSSARIYKLAWSDGTPMTVIGMHGGLLERPVRQQYLTLAPAQRADVILDLSRQRVGHAFELRSVQYPIGDVDRAGMGMGRMGRMGRMGSMRGMRGRGGMGGVAQEAVPNGAPLSLMRLSVARQEASTFTLPEKLSTFATPAGAVMLPVRRVEIGFEAGQWRLGGRTFEMMATAPDEVVPAGSSQVWELVNVRGMMGMPMAHPIHLHGRQFRVLGRAQTAGAAAQSIREGIVDDGWTDTVLVLPGETVRIQAYFTEFPGLYLYHCHILEHEDMGMMRNFRVT